MGIVYKLDFASGRSYIGITIRPLRVRISQHRTEAKSGKHQFAVHRAWAKYGEPIITVITEADGEELNDAERQAIRQFNTLAPFGYNLSIGGDMPDVSNETRQKISKVHKGKNKSDEHKTKIGAAHKGRKFSEETLEKMRQAQRARDPATRKNLGDFWKGKTQSEEHKQKRAATHIGKKRSAEARSNMSAGRKSKHATQQSL